MGDYYNEVLSCLPSAEQGDPAAQARLCRMFYGNPKMAELMPDDFWEKIEEIARKDEEYANFIMHCRYFGNPEQAKQAYHYVCKAAQNGKNAFAYLRLGIICANGIGRKQNHTLANYFYEKALSLGLEEAESYIEQAYETGTKDIVTEAKAAAEQFAELPPNTLKRIKEQIEKERIKNNYGRLSKLRDQLLLFYPDYDREQAIRDILDGKDSKDADIFFALGTSDNGSEYDIERQESLLHQLYAHFLQDSNLLKGVSEYSNADKLITGIYALVHALGIFSSSYRNVCEEFGVKRQELLDVTQIWSYPYIKPATLLLLRKQVLRCLLSAKDVSPLINDKYLNYLGSDDQLLDLCDKVPLQQLQLFLITFVEVNMEIDNMEKVNLSLLQYYRNNQLEALAEHLNAAVYNLTQAGIKHHLPEYTAENLPPISIS